MASRIPRATWRIAPRAAAIDPGFKVFPSTEAVLPEARAGTFAGCISATATSMPICARRGLHRRRSGALDAAVTIRKLFDGRPLVPGIKALLGHIHGDQAWGGGLCLRLPPFRRPTAPR